MATLRKENLNTSALPVFSCLDILSSESAYGAVDTACGLSLAGSPWWEDYLQLLQACHLEDRVTVRPCFERFRFGGGQLVTACEQIRAPVVIAGVPMMITFCIVDVKTLPLLLGRNFLGGNRWRGEP